MKCTFWRLVNAALRCLYQMFATCSRCTDSTYSALISHSLHSMCSTAQRAQHVQYYLTPVGQTTIWHCPLTVNPLPCLPCRYQQLCYKWLYSHVVLARFHLQLRPNACCVHPAATPSLLWLMTASLAQHKLSALAGQPWFPYSSGTRLQIQIT